MQAYSQILERDVNYNSNFLRMFRENNEPETSFLRGHKGKDFYISSVLPQQTKEVQLSLVPFSNGKQWFSIGIDYFDEVFESKRVHNFGFNDQSYIKGFIVHNNLYVPFVDLSNLLSLNTEEQVLKLMIVISDSARSIAIGADEILRPERLSIGYNLCKGKDAINHDFVLKNIQLGNKSVGILNVEEILSFVEDDLS